MVERVRGGPLAAAFVLAPLKNAPQLACVEIATEPIARSGYWANPPEGETEACGVVRAVLE